jgi:hypothetical protein
MAWMLRVAKIPARVAFGFTRGAGGANGTYTMTNLNLHAWTEVFFGGGIGWVPFDATPPSAITGAVTPSWAPGPGNTPAPVIANGPLAPNPSDNPSDDVGAAPKSADNGSGSGAASTSAPRTPITTWPWWVLGAVTVFLLLAGVPGARRAALRRRRQPRWLTGTTAVTVDAAAPPGEMRPVVSHDQAVQEAHAVWYEFVDTLVDYDIPIDDSQTPRVVARGVARHLEASGPPDAALQLLGRAEERARYARAPLAGVDLSSALRLVRQSVTDAASRRTRLRAAILPPSVLRRWRYQFTTGATGVIARMGRWRDSTTRLVNVRRLLAGRTGARL